MIRKGDRVRDKLTGNVTIVESIKYKDGIRYYKIGDVSYRATSLEPLSQHSKRDTITDITIKGKHIKIIER